MARRPAPVARPVRGPAAGAPRRWWYVLGLAAGIPVVVNAVLYGLYVPLGCPGRFVYLYSPAVPQRLAAVPCAVLLGAAAAAGAWLTVSASAGRRRTGLALAVVAAGGLGAWAYLAPPRHLNQHVFNIHSPSQDGAFVLEALQVDGVRSYLRSFPERARTSPDAMRGTRVISNPPGATLLAVGVERWLGHVPGVRAWLTAPIRAEFDSPEELGSMGDSAAVGLMFLLVLTTLWAASGLVLYGVGRLFVPTAAALAFSLGCVFTPATLLFSPGKDAAQLLTVAVPLYLWLWAYRRDRPWAAVAAGLATVGAVLLSLIHVWAAGITVLATVLAAARSGVPQRRVWRRGVLPALVGFVLGGLGLYFLAGLNLLATALAVARSQAEVTGGASAMPLVWQMLGVPLFLLFAGPAWWVITAPTVFRAERARDADAHLGLVLVLAAAGVMLLTVGRTNSEAPRLWIPFVPLLLLGGLLQVRRWRAPEGGGGFLAALVLVQIACAALQWSLMDMREAEHRLAFRQFFG